MSRRVRPPRPPRGSRRNPDPVVQPATPEELQRFEEIASAGARRGMSRALPLELGGAPLPKLGSISTVPRVRLEPAQDDMCENAYEGLLSPTDVPNGVSTIVIVVNARSAKMAGLFYDLRRRYSNPRHGFQAVKTAYAQALMDFGDTLEDKSIEMSIDEYFVQDPTTGELSWRDHAMQSSVEEGQSYDRLRQIAQKITYKLTPDVSSLDNLLRFKSTPVLAERDWYLPIGLEEEIRATSSGDRQISFGILSGFGLPSNPQQPNQITNQISLFADRISFTDKRPVVGPFVQLSRWTSASTGHNYVINFVASGEVNRGPWAILPEDEKNSTSAAIFESLLTAGTWDFEKKDWKGSLIFALPAPLWDPRTKQDLTKSYLFAASLVPFTQQYIGQINSEEIFTVTLTFKSKNIVDFGDVQYTILEDGRVQNKKLDITGGLISSNRFLLDSDLGAVTLTVNESDDQGPYLTLTMPSSLIEKSKVEKVKLRPVTAKLPTKTMGREFVSSGITQFQELVVEDPIGVLAFLLSCPIPVETKNKFAKMCFTLSALKESAGGQNRDEVQNKLYVMYQKLQEFHLGTLEESNEEPFPELSNLLEAPEELELTDVIDSPWYFYGEPTAPKSRRLPFGQKLPVSFALPDESGKRDLKERLTRSTHNEKIATNLRDQVAFIEAYGESFRTRQADWASDISRVLHLLKKEISRILRANEFYTSITSSVQEEVKALFSDMASNVTRLNVELRGNYAFDLGTKTVVRATTDNPLKFFMDPLHFYGDSLALRELALVRQNYISSLYPGTPIPTLRLILNATKGSTTTLSKGAKIQEESNNLTATNVSTELAKAPKSEPPILTESAKTTASLLSQRQVQAREVLRKHLIPFSGTRLPNGGYVDSPIISLTLRLMGPRNGLDPMSDKREGKVETELINYFKEKGAPPSFMGKKEDKGKKEVINLGLGENANLSNRTPRRFNFLGVDFQSVEHAFQTMKSGQFDWETWQQPDRFINASRGIRGKKLNYKIAPFLISDLMYFSFSQNEAARAALLATTGRFDITEIVNPDWREKVNTALDRVREDLKNNVQRVMPKDLSYYDVVALRAKEEEKSTRVIEPRVELYTVSLTEQRLKRVLQKTREDYINSLQLDNQSAETAKRIRLRFGSYKKTRDKIELAILTKAKKSATRYPSEALRYGFKRGELRIARIGDEDIPVVNLGAFTFEELMAFIMKNSNAKTQDEAFATYLHYENVQPNWMGNLPKYIETYKNEKGSVRNWYVFDAQWAGIIQSKELADEKKRFKDIELLSSDLAKTSLIADEHQQLLHTPTIVPRGSGAGVITIGDIEVFGRSLGTFTFMDFCTRLGAQSLSTNPFEGGLIRYGKLAQIEIRGGTPATTDPILAEWYAGKRKLCVFELSRVSEFGPYPDEPLPFNKGNALIKWFLTKANLLGENGAARIWADLLDEPGHKRLANTFQVVGEVKVDLDRLRVVSPNVPRPIQVSNDIGLFKFKFRALPSLFGTKVPDPDLLEVYESLMTENVLDNAYGIKPLAPKSKDTDTPLESYSSLRFSFTGSDISGILPPPIVQIIEGEERGSLFYEIAKELPENDTSSQFYPDDVVSRGQHLLSRIASGECRSIQVSPETAQAFDLTDRATYGLQIGRTGIEVKVSYLTTGSVLLEFFVKGDIEQDLDVTLARMAEVAKLPPLEIPKTKSEIALTSPLSQEEVEIEYLREQLDYEEKKQIRLQKLGELVRTTGDYDHRVDLGLLKDYLDELQRTEASVMSGNVLPSGLMGLSDESAEKRVEFGQTMLEELARTNSPRYGRWKRPPRGEKRSGLSRRKSHSRRNPVSTTEDLESIIAYATASSDQARASAYEKANAALKKTGPTLEFKKEAIETFFPREGREAPSTWGSEQRLRAGLPVFDLMSRARPVLDSDMIDDTTPYSTAASTAAKKELMAAAKPFFSTTEGANLLKSQAEVSVDEALGILNQQRESVERLSQTKQKFTINASSAVCKNFRGRRLSQYKIPSSIINAIDEKGGWQNSCLLLMSPKYIAESGGQLIANDKPRLMTWRRGDHIDCDMIGNQASDMIRLLGKSLQSALLWLGEKPIRRTEGRTKTRLFVGRVGDPEIYLAWEPGEPLTIAQVTANLQNKDRVLPLTVTPAQASQDIKDFLVYEQGGVRSSAPRAERPFDEQTTTVPTEPVTQPSEIPQPLIPKGRTAGKLKQGEPSVEYNATMPKPPSVGTTYQYKPADTDLVYTIEITKVEADKVTLVATLQAPKTNPRRRYKR